MRRYLQEKKKIAALITLFAAMTANAASPSVLDLSGKWDFGYGDTTVYNDMITLPGSMLTNGKGNDVDASTKWTGSLYDMSYYHSDRYSPYREKGNIKFPFFLTPDKEYVGNAYYRRKVDIPSDWKGQRIVLHLERPHIETTLKVNGKEVGHRMSLSVPHEYDITRFVRPGKSNEIELTVYNGIENVCVGQDSHSVTDQTQGNWNGVTGKMLLRATPADAYIRNVRVYPDLRGRKADIVVIRGGKSRKQTDVSVTAVSADGLDTFTASSPVVVGDTMKFVIDMGDKMKTWDEFSPHLYDLTVRLGNDTATTVFGMRNIAVSGLDMTINGRPLYLRGTVENCCFPLTGYAPTDEESWRSVFEKCREYGINMMRFHSYCPPEAAFAAADKVGIYLQPEGPSWPNHGVKLNAGMAIDDYLLDESKRIVDSYGNHPSFVMMAAGNEPAGNWVPYCNRWVSEMKDYDASKIYCGASVGGGWAWDDGSEYHVKGGGRGLAWSKNMPSSDDDYSADIKLPRNFKPSPGHPENTSPILAHEQGQWCAFPDLSETSLYTGPYKARNFEIFKDLLAKNGMAGMDRKFLMASGNLQALCYKYEIERNLRTPDYSGFQLLALNDYSGQGTALEGVLNVFWKEKGYIDGEKWREFCSEIVPLAEFPRFVFTDRDTVRVPVQVMNASASPLEASEISYTISDSSGKEVTCGQLPVTTIPIGKNNRVGEITIDYAGVKQPMCYTLTVNVGGKARNSWQYWVYPEEPAAEFPSDIYVADSLDTKAVEVLAAGGKVLLTAAGKVTLGNDIVQHYLPVFWNTSWFKMRPPHTTGAYIDLEHPLFSHGFPSDSWSNLNWWELLNRAQVMNLLELPSGYRSPVQPIDTWHLSRKLGMIVEANVLDGKLFMTTMDIDRNLDKRVVAKRMRNAIIDYMSSDSFKPSITLDPSAVASFFTRETPPVEMYTNDSPDELKPKLK